MDALLLPGVAPADDFRQPRTRSTTLSMQFLRLVILYFVFVFLDY
jgi:hypothetical protein